jgi:predicted alpha/beta superfamily hydrolase
VTRSVRLRAASPVAARGHFVTLDRVEVPGLSTRRVRVYLPGGFDAQPERPSLWLFDGQNVFGDEGSYAGGWHTHEAADKLPRGVLRPAIVGIDHGGTGRIDELAPFSDGKKGGHLDALLGFVVGVLMPRLRRELGLSAGPARVIAGGSSMGGLAAIYTHFRHPEAFGGALCMSPSLWFAGRAIFPFIAAQGTPWTSRVYLDCGAREARGAMLGIVRGLATDLRRRGYGDDKLLYRPDSKGTHSEAHWRRRFPRALKWVMGGK